MNEFDLWLEILKISNPKIYHALERTTDLDLLKQNYEISANEELKQEEIEIDL